MNTKRIILICLIAITATCAICIGLIGSTQNINKQGLIVENVTVSEEGFLQKFTADIIPDKDYDYLSAKIVYYDNNGVVLYSQTILWNMLDIHKGEHIKMQGTSNSYDYLGKPATAKIFFFDTAVNQKENKALYVYTVNYQ